MLRVSVVLLLLIAGSSVPAQPTPLPENVAGVVEASNLQTLQNRLAEYAAAASGEKVSPALGGMALMGLTYSTNAGLIEAERPFRLWLLKGDDGRIAAVAAFTVKGPSAFRSSLRGDLKKTEEKEGLALYTRSVREFDRKAYRQATPDERRDFQRFMKTREETVAVGETESLMCVGKDAGAVRRLMTLATDGKLPEGALFPESDAGLWLNAETLTARTAGEGRLLDPWREGLHELPAPVKAGAIGAILEEYLTAIESLAAQTTALTARATATPQELRLRIGLSVRPKTPLAAYLASVPKGYPETLKYAPEDSAFVFATRMGDVRPLAEWLIGVQDRAAAQAKNPRDLKDWAEKTRRAAEGYGDDFAIAVAGGLPLRGVTALRMKDAAAARTEIERMTDAMNPLTGVWHGVGMNLKIEDAAPVTQIGGAPVWQRRYTIGLNLPEQGDTNRAAAAAMSVMYGPEVRLTSTVSGRDALSAAGPDSLERIHGILNGKARSLADSSDFAALMKTLPPETQAVAFLRLTDLAALAMGIGRKMAEELQPKAQENPLFPEMSFQRGPGVLLALRTTPDGAAADLCLPAAELRRCADGFKRAMTSRVPAVKGAPPKK